MHLHYCSVSVGLSKGIRVYKMVIGNNMNCHKDFLRSLDINLQEVISVGQSDVIIAFVPIVSRAKTDIQAALKYIPGNCSQQQERLNFFPWQML